MTLRTFLNNTTGIKGVTTASGVIVNVEAGATSPPLEVTEADLSRLKAHGYFTVSKATQGDVEAAKVAAPAPAIPAALAPAPGPNAAERLLAQVNEGGRDEDQDGDGDDTGGDDDDHGGEGDIVDDFTPMRDEALRAFITDRDGKAPHHKAGRPKLLAQARTEPKAPAEDNTEGV